MPFPLSVSGDVFVHGVAAAVAVERLQAALAREKAAALRSAGGTIRFHGGSFPYRMVWNSNLLVPITTGEIDVEPRRGGVRVRYRLTFTRFVTGSTLVVVAWLGLIAASAHTPPYAVVLSMAALVWLLTVPGGFVATRLRFAAFVKRALVLSPES